ncbi:atypical protein kinase C-like [Galendromus occidentalis]|uniref:Atypical protein kinase C-like n=1 Tax=Galendromus occidentalis TaxID=34638 RepID=A0AAJ6QPG8_9ACAR|nr:atypical protein kinase C-like [Galendromus occidentalis]
MAAYILRLPFAIARNLISYFFTKVVKFENWSIENGPAGKNPSASLDPVLSERASVSSYCYASDDGVALRRDMMNGSLSKSCLSLDGAPELENYELIKVIGRGSYSTVFMVEHRSSQELYAMKVMSKQRATRDEYLDCIRTEERVLRLALSCNFLVGLQASFESSKRFYFVMDIARGGDLMYHMQQAGRFVEVHARFYSAEICLALEFLHGEGVIYRDLKLDNVLLDHEGHVKLCDYGMCREGISENNRSASTLCGTPNYLAPEMLCGQDYAFGIDWWALGVLLYEMLVGLSPFNSCGDLNIAQWDLDELIREILFKDIIIPDYLSEEAKLILRALLKRDPAERLGCRPDKGSAEIRAHSFFAELDWDKLSKKSVAPPFKPRLSSNRDSRCFDPRFTSEAVELSEDEEWQDRESQDSESFSSFDYEAELCAAWRDRRRAECASPPPAATESPRRGGGENAGGAPSNSVVNTVHDAA